MAQSERQISPELRAALWAHTHAKRGAQKELADRLGMPSGNLGRFASGVTLSTTPETITAIAEAIGFALPPSVAVGHPPAGTSSVLPVELEIRVDDGKVFHLAIPPGLVLRISIANDTIEVIHKPLPVDRGTEANTGSPHRTPIDFPSRSHSSRRVRQS